MRRLDWRVPGLFLVLGAAWLAVTLFRQWQTGPPRASELVPAEQHEGSNAHLPER
jgi:hypothetical protein